MTDAEWVANGQNSIAHLQAVHLTQNDDGQIGQVNFEQRQIGVGVGAYDLGQAVAAIVEIDFDGFCTFNDVVVRENVAFWTDDDAAAHATALGVIFGLFKKTEPGIGAPGLGAGFLLHRDADHSWRCFERGLPEATARGAPCIAIQDSLSK